MEDLLDSRRSGRSAVLFPPHTDVGTTEPLDLVVNNDNLHKYVRVELFFKMIVQLQKEWRGIISIGIIPSQSPPCLILYRASDRIA